MPDISAGPADDLESDPVFVLHRGGKMEIAQTVALEGREDLSMAYTPGVARVCEAIAARPELAHDYTWVSNTVAVVTDGTAELGVGRPGPAAAQPGVEGEAAPVRPVCWGGGRAHLLADPGHPWSGD